jgi:hypothetical protein
MAAGRDEGKGRGPEGESLAEVLASIRALVTAETAARLAGGEGETVLMLTADMRTDAPPASAAGGEGLAEGLGEGLDAEAAAAQPAPNLDEAALRAMINAIVREELQGELGERINRNLRKLIRREIAEFLEERERKL